MKRNAFDRVLLAIILFVVFVIALAVLAIGLRLLPLEIVQGVFALLYTGVPNAVILCVVAVVVIVIVLRLAFGGREKQEVLPSAVSIRNTDNGTLSISLAAIDSMVQKHCRSNPRLKDCKSTIIPDQGCIKIVLRVVAMPDSELPMLLENLQKSLKEYVENCSGVAVRDVKIMVEDTPFDPKSRVG